MVPERQGLILDLPLIQGLEQRASFKIEIQQRGEETVAELTGATNKFLTAANGLRGSQS